MTEFKAGIYPDYQGFGLVGRGHDVQKIAILSALTGRKNQNI